MIPWIQAWRLAATAFYQAEQPNDHFRTCVQESDIVAQALAQLMIDLASDLAASDLAATDLAATEGLDADATLDLVDVGGGNGELIVAVMAVLHQRSPELALRCRPVVIDMRARPDDLPASITWIVGSAPEAVPTSITGLLIAHELLDDVPLEIAMYDDSGQLRTVVVDPATGREALGDEASRDMLAWTARWWPGVRARERVEVGSTRDAMWCALTSCIDRGIGIAVDYAHSREQRAEHRWPNGSLAGYQGGRSVPPIPNGSMNVTAQVALDSCADAAAHAARTRRVATQFALLTQRDALAWMTGTGMTTVANATTPQQRLVDLARHSHLQEARNPDGFGAFTWLVQSMGMAIPAALPSGSIT